jgi:Domain of unknown function (DUF4326)
MTEEKLIYIADFYSQPRADALLEFIRSLPSVRPRNARNAKSSLRRLSFPGYAPSADAYPTEMQRENMGGTVVDAPPLYQKLSADLTAYGGKEQNYLSTIGYLPDDHMGFHQHAEDMVREDQTVLVLSLGAVHPVAIRYGATVGKKFVPDGRQEIIHPAHGSLYVLPSAFNSPGSGGEAQHAVLDGNDWSHGGLRVSINCKHIPAGLTPEEFDKACSRPAGRSNSQSGSLFVREPGPPRIYCLRKGCQYPDDAIRVDKATVYGNHKKLHGQEWIAETERLMRDPEFAAKVKAMKGHDLLCWCERGEPNCHARQWLELANKEKP